MSEALDRVEEAASDIFDSWMTFGLFCLPPLVLGAAFGALLAARRRR